MVYVTYQGGEERRAHSRWQAETAYLPATQREIPLPENLRLCVLPKISREELQRERFLGGHERGLTTILFNEYTQLFEIKLGTRPLRNRVGKPKNHYFNVFAQGHEEGHAYQHTGNLELLYEEAHRLGYQFTFFSRRLAQESDAAWQWFHEKPHSFRNLMDFLADHAHTQEEQNHLLIKLGKAFRPIRWGFGDYDITEHLANVGGLVALVKANAPKPILKRAARHIKEDTLRA